MGSHDGAVTLFVISDALEEHAFCEMLTEALNAFDRLTVGCHGHTHRSWSAWDADPDGFQNMLETSTGSSPCCWSGVSAVLPGTQRLRWVSWMAPVLVQQGFRAGLLNQSLVVGETKAGGARWSDESRHGGGGADRTPLVDFRLTLPVNGPALFRFSLSLVARRAWKKRHRSSEQPTFNRWRTPIVDHHRLLSRVGFCTKQRNMGAAVAEA
ncbi:MAG: hypothetical protein CM15mP78_00040 [Candidatus Poseidoniales archaeon]|nr:MAG: hypothetical protein CM15mP78_00040 [Candidatus Poseidoniales archaeon]